MLLLLGLVTFGVVVFTIIGLPADSADNDESIMTNPDLTMQQSIVPSESPTTSVAMSADPTSFFAKSMLCNLTVEYESFLVPEPFNICTERPRNWSHTGAKCSSGIYASKLTTAVIHRDFATLS